jgi:putative two-component system response regulator
MARDIAPSHHERWNGTGYRKALKGDAIPLCGRIVSLADVFDALTTHRVYKEAFTVEITRSMIAKESGNQFDPRVVDAYVAIEDQFLRIREQLRDAMPLAA